MYHLISSICSVLFYLLLRGGNAGERAVPSRCAGWKGKGTIITIITLYFILMLLCNLLAMRLGGEGVEGKSDLTIEN